MIIGVPKEIKNNENRVALTPAGAKELIKRGHQVHVQQSAGLGSVFLTKITLLLVHTFCQALKPRIKSRK